MQIEIIVWDAVRVDGALCVLKLPLRASREALVMYVVVAIDMYVDSGDGTCVCRGGWR